MQWEGDKIQTLCQASALIPNSNKNPPQLQSGWQIGFLCLMTTDGVDRVVQRGDPSIGILPV
jgi:hypothetical protein